MRYGQLKGSAWSVRQNNKYNQCIVSQAIPTGRIATVRRIRHYNNGHDVGFADDTGGRVIRESAQHAWFESTSVENIHG